MKLLSKILYLFPLLFLTTLFFNNLGSGWAAYENIYVFYLCSSILLLLCLLICLNLTKPINVSWSDVDRGLCLLTIYIFFHALIQKDLSFSNEKIISGIYLLLLYVLFKVVFSQPQGKKVFPFVIMFTGTIAAIHGLAQLFHFLPSANKAFLVTSSFGNPGPYSGYLVAGAPLTLSILFNKNEKKILFRIIPMVAVFCIGLILFITQSRSAWLASFVSILFIFKNQFQIFQKIRTLWVVIAVIFLMLALVLAPMRSDSASGRLLIWKVSYEMWKDAPLSGIGPGQFAIQYNNYQADYFRHHPGEKYYATLADNTYYAFNEFIEIAVEYGIIGLALFLLLLYFIFRENSSNFEEQNSLVKGAKATILGVCIFGLFSYPFSSIPILLIFVSCLALVSSYEPQQKIITINKHLNFYKGFILIALVLISFITYKVFKKYSAIKQWKEAYKLVLSEDTTEAFKDYKAVYPALQNHGGFLFNYGGELAEAEFYMESVVELEKAKQKFNHIDLYIFLGNSYKGLKLYSKAENAYLQASFMIPNRFYPKYLLAQLYLEQNKKDKALKQAKEILAMKVKVKSQTVQAIKEEMRELVNQHE